MAHCNTLFQQMLKPIPRHRFSSLEAEHGTGRQARSFTRWNQLVHLVFIEMDPVFLDTGLGDNQ